MIHSDTKEPSIYPLWWHHAGHTFITSVVILLDYGIIIILTWTGRWLHLGSPADCRHRLWYYYHPDMDREVATSRISWLWYYYHPDMDREVATSRIPCLLQAPQVSVVSTILEIPRFHQGDVIILSLVSPRTFQFLVKQSDLPPAITPPPPLFKQETFS